MNKKIGIIVGTIFALLLISITPAMLKKDSSLLESYDITCAKVHSKKLFSTMENIMILKFAVDGKDGEVLQTTAYTFFGRPYAKTELFCEENDLGKVIKN